MIDVLLADDDPSTLQGLRNYIDWAGLGVSDIRCASNGEQALQLFADKPADIMVIDIYMPYMDGLSVIRTLRSQNVHCPIIILSGYEEFENARQAMNMGANHFLLKPCVIEEIEELLRQLIEDIRVRERQESFLELYEQEWKEMLPVMQKQWLSHLISTRYRPGEIIDEQVAMLELDKYGSIAVVSLQTIRPVYLMSRFKERDWQLIKYGSANVIEEILKESLGPASLLKAITLDYNENMFVIVFLGETESFPQAEVERIVAHIIKSIVLYLKLSVLAGMGLTKFAYHQLIDSYLESQKALELGEYGEFNRLYRAEDIADKSANGPDAELPPLEYLGHLYGAMHRKDYQQVLDMWGKIRNQLEASPAPSLQMPRHVCESILHAFLMSEKTAAAKFRTVLLEIEHATELTPLLSRMDLVVKEWVELEMKEWSSGRQHHLVEQVKAYVEQHYTREILFSDIAKQLFISRTYLSQLFKKVTGENFVSYLNKYRVHKAKELLKTGHYMVYEVGQMVGYQNPTYFSEVFRGITGIRPSEFYRKEVEMP